MKTIYSLFCGLITLLFLMAPSSECAAASDTDVYSIKPTKVLIEDDRITVTGDAEVKMVIIVPENDPVEKSLRFVGRNSTRVNVDAREATFVVERPHKLAPDSDAWQMTVNAAKDLQAGKGIGRIGYYRPKVTIENNRITAVTGKAYIYPKRKKS